MNILSLKTNVTILQGNVSSLQGTVSVLQSTVVGMQSNISTLQSNLASAQSLVNSVCALKCLLVDANEDDDDLASADDKLQSCGTDLQPDFWNMWSSSDSW